MERYFVTEEGKKVNVIDHCLEQLKLHPNLTFHIGTDSQNKGDYSVYVTVLVFRHGLRGAHFVSLTNKIPRIRDIFTRLYKEAEYTIEAATMITEAIPISFEGVEFDYNNKKLTKSTNVIAATKGWAESLGFKAKVKPDELIAIKAADYICRR